MNLARTGRLVFRTARRGRRRLHRWLLSAVAAVLLWWALVLLFDLPPFILPTPLQVALRGWDAIKDGTLLYHTWITLQEVLSGLALGAGAATVLGYILAKSRTLERLLEPYLVASQSVPVVAIAPLLIIWFGTGLLAKTLICALIVFFPVLVNTVVGIRSVPDELRDLLRTLDATPWQMVRYLEIPAALPVFLGGLRIGATLSVIGAVVGEFVAADSGLGFLINLARGRYDTAMVFVAVFALVTLALVLYGSVLLLEHRFLGWQAPAARSQRR